jgi:hypothetical protein
MEKKSRIEIERLFPGQKGRWISLDWRVGPQRSHGSGRTEHREACNQFRASVNACPLRTRYLQLQFAQFRPC